MSSLSVIAGNAGIIVTGGQEDVSAGKGDARSSVELIREDGTTCTLTSLPQNYPAYYEHTQAGLLACGGCCEGSIRRCIKFATWTWARSHTLAVERMYHVCWGNYPGGVLLLGGYNYSGAKRSTELLSSTSSTTTPQFGLTYDAQ